MEYSIKESTLTATADAIRTQLGETDSINPLDFAEAILSISGGGGGSQLNLSTVTLASESTTLTFEHDLGEAPTFCVVFPTNPSEIVGQLSYKVLGTMTGLVNQGIAGTGSNKLARNVSSTSNFSFDNTENDIVFNNTNATYKFAIGIEYSCIYW